MNAAKPVHDKVVESTKKKIQECGNEEEKASLQEELDESAKNWENITKQADTRQKNIDKLMKPAQRFYEKERAFVVVLKDLEKRSKELDDTKDKHKKPEEMLKENKVELNVL